MQSLPTNPDRLEQPVLLIDDAGDAWQLRTKRLDLRVVRRLIKDKAAVVVLGESGGTRPRLAVDDERSILWGKLKDSYMGPGGEWSTGRYLAHEFHAEAGHRMLYIEDHC
ncbi:hypothetical protein GCM10009839_32050 [Catenulispora yoronensis]|uniref:Uncharacterized protein n=1 Tax=Catenulispora yoronensis TaxID=450799 RepID=A0ABN2U6R1_9ACTN